MRHDESRTDALTAVIGGASKKHSGHFAVVSATSSDRGLISRQAGVFEGCIDGTPIAQSRTPFFDAARYLVGKGFAPDTVLRSLYS